MEPTVKVSFVNDMHFSVGLLLADENEYRLIRDIFVSYDKRVRPSIHHSQAVNVTYGVALAQIIDVVSGFFPYPFQEIRLV